MEKLVNIELTKDETRIIQDALYYYKRTIYKHDIDIKSLERIERKFNRAVLDSIRLKHEVNKYGRN